MSENRLPPHSIEAEESVLSAILVDPECIYDIARLAPEHFYSTTNGTVFQGLKEMMAAGIKPDMITVPDYIVDIDMMWLMGVAAQGAASYQVSSYADIVVNKHKRRELIRAASEIAALAWKEEEDIDTVVDEASSLFYDTVAADVDSDLVPIHDVADTAIAKITERATAGGVFQGLRTGYPKLDYFLRGLKVGEMTVICARPGMGKTALVTNITEHIARAGGHVAFFSLEMSAEQLTYRLIAQMSGVSYSDVEEGNRMMPGGQRFSDVMTAAGEIAEMPIHIDESMGTAEQMFSKVRRLIATSQVDVVMVDFLQLMSSSRNHGNRTQDVTSINHGLKALAKQLKIPVIALSQLNRGVEGRQDYHPKLSDLRDSGTIEEDAAVVMSIYRPDYYLPDDEMEPDEVGVADVDVLKNRFGATGRAKLGWDGTCGRFTNDVKVVDL